MSEWAADQENYVITKCVASTWWEDADLDLLAAMPGGRPRKLEQIFCELQTDHPGPHIAYAQAIDDAGEEAAWWLLWDDTTGWRKLTELAYCPAGDRDPHAESNSLCLLPTHPAAHSFQIVTVLPPLRTAGARESLLELP